MSIAIERVLSNPSYVHVRPLRAWDWEEFDVAFQQWRDHQLQAEAALPTIIDFSVYDKLPKGLLVQLPAVAQLLPPYPLPLIVVQPPRVLETVGRILNRVIIAEQISVRAVPSLAQARSLLQARLTTRSGV